jgi:mono/diheme cytochrome c family protein
MRLNPSIARGTAANLSRAGALALTAAALATGIAHGQPVSLVDQGAELFREHGCYGCHAIGKFGTPIAPDLSKIGGKHDETYLARWLHDPTAQRETAHMPNLSLSDADVKALAAFLAAQR